jgi:nicotinamide-nucleotide amidase
MHIHETILELRDHCVEQALTLAAAESLTGGRIQSLITSQSGASRFFLGGMTAYHLQAKATLLGVDRDEAQRCNCVSQLVAEQMAAGICRAFDSSLGIATTGYAEPSPPDGVQTPFAFIAGCRVNPDNPDQPTILFSERIEHDGDRESVQSHIAATTIFRLRNEIV